MDELTEEKAREIVKVYEAPDAHIVFTEDEKKYFRAKGFLFGLSQARKEAEPLVKKGEARDEKETNS
jgi:hypothetical protein